MIALASQLRVQALPVGARELALLAVELRVADLAVDRLLARLEVGQLGALGLPFLLAAAPAQRRDHERREHGTDD